MPSRRRRRQQGRDSDPAQPDLLDRRGGDPRRRRAGRSRRRPAWRVLRHGRPYPRDARGGPRGGIGRGGGPRARRARRTRARLDGRRPLRPYVRGPAVPDLGVLVRRWRQLVAMGLARRLHPRRSAHRIHMPTSGPNICARAPRPGRGITRGDRSSRHRRPRSGPRTPGRATEGSSPFCGSSQGSATSSSRCFSASRQQATHRPRSECSPSSTASSSSQPGREPAPSTPRSSRANACFPAGRTRGLT